MTDSEIISFLRYRALCASYVPDQQIFDLMADRYEQLRAELDRLTTRRPMNELTQEDGPVLLHDTAWKSKPPPMPSVADVAMLDLRVIELSSLYNDNDPDDLDWRTWYGGWTRLPKLKDYER